MQESSNAKLPVAKADLTTRKALGRGLAALLPSTPSASVSEAVQANGYRLLPIDMIHPNKRQPRKHFEPTSLAELAQSIGDQGVLQPLLVRRLKNNGYEIVAGERRWRAAGLAGLRQVPVMIHELTDKASLQVALIENIQRQDLDPLEEAESYHRLLREHGLTQDALAASVGKSRPAIANALRLLKLPEEVLHMLADGRLTAGHARALMMLKNETTIKRLAQDLVGRQATVRQAESQARRLANAEKSNSQELSSKPPVSRNLKSLQTRLQRALATKVQVHEQAGQGRVEIFFHSLDQLDGLLEILLPTP